MNFKITLSDKIIYGFILSLLLFFPIKSTGNELPREKISFNDGWFFQLGDISSPIDLTTDFSTWRKLNLPHDWAIEGDFSKGHPSGSSGGALPGGIGWYCKKFSLQPEEKKKIIYIDFDGVYMNSEVYINGHLLGIRPYGYISFRYDLTPYLKEGQENIIAVKVDNSEQPNSRWYSGCGIYRNVWLTKVNPVHVDLWGTFITTPHITSEYAVIEVKTTLVNKGEREENVKISSVILDETKNPLACESSLFTITNATPSETTHTLSLESPIKWSIEKPYLYTLRTEVYINEQLTDCYDTPFGVRQFTFDAQNGFILNGEVVKIKGVCQHHDLGCLGAAVNTRAIERQLEILKAMGCNGIRTAHNPPAPELLDLCDQMGFIVMDEAFDMWRKKKSAHDYSRYFNEWHEKDLTDLILRDRNHPSIFMWSIGNEVLEQWTHTDADTLDLEQANLLLNFKRDESAWKNDTDNLSVNALLTKKLATLVKELDPTRPVTAGNNEPNIKNHLFRSNALDIIGYNYQDTHFRKIPERFPNQPFIVTESTSALMTRGYYRMPSDSMYIWPSRWDMDFYDESYSCSSYDNCHVPWGTTHEKTWKLVKENDFISGMYVWTGFDYLGEPTPFTFPARSSYFGIIDLAGFPKDIYYMYQSEWIEKPVLHLFPHWNWTEGELVDVWVYYSQADEVELYVNGKSQGVKHKDGTNFYVTWRIPFQAGNIKVISRKAGKEVLTKEINTAGTPSQIRLSADRTNLKADGKDLSFITVEILDEAGNLCPHAENLVNFSVEGEAFIAGVDNGSQFSMENFKTPYRKAFYGKCLVVLQSKERESKIKLTATSEGLLPTSIYLETHTHKTKQ